MESIKNSNAADDKYQEQIEENNLRNEKIGKKITKIIIQEIMEGVFISIFGFSGPFQFFYKFYNSTEINE